MVYKPPRINKNTSKEIEDQYKAEKEKNKSRFNFMKIMSNEAQRYSFLKLLDRIIIKLEDDLQRVGMELAELRKQKNPDLAVLRELEEREKNLIEDQQKIPLAVLVFEYTSTPEAGMLTNGSMMHKVLRTFLQLSEDSEKTNELSDEEVFIYTQKLLNYVDRNMKDEDVKDLTWRNKRTLLAAVDSHLATTHQKLKDKFTRFVNGLPELDALIANLKKAIEQYETIAKRHPLFRTPKRLDACKFLLFIVQSCQKMYPLLKLGPNPTAEELIINNNNELNQWSVIAAAELLIYKSISDNCTWYNGSELCRQILTAMRQDTINRIPDSAKTVFWGTLRTHLEKVQLPGNYAVLQHDWEKGEWVKIGRIVDSYKKELDVKCSQIIVNNHANGSKTQWLVSKSMAWGATLGVAATAAIARSYVLPILLTFATEVLPLAIAGTPVGFLLVIAAAAGSTILVPVLLNKSVGSLASYLFASGVDTAGRKIGRSMAGVLVGSNGNSDYQDIYGGSLLGVEEAQVKRELVKAWLDAPSHIISQKDKQKVCEVLNLRKDMVDEELPKVRRFGRM